MRGAGLALWVAATFVMAGCVQEAQAKPQGFDAPAPDANTGQILGTVTDDSILPVAGATVGVLDGPTKVETVTNDAGQYVLGGLEPGRYLIVAQRLGYEPASRSIDVQAAARSDASFQLKSMPVAGEALHLTLTGDGYFACGADTPAVTWGNLHACVWDDHKPRFPFKASKTGIKGILLEISWKQSTALTSKTLEVYLSYQQVCSPFCSATATWGNAVSTSPVRSYIDFQKEAKKVKEDPMPLESITFPNRGSDPVVVVFQQRMTHYVTNFWGEHCLAGVDDDCPMDAFTALPDA